MFTYNLLPISFLILVNAKPNFVLILTDDQDLILNSLLPMKNTLQLVANKGKVFENAFVNSPICCPSRSTILTGKYAHNTGVVNNSISGNCSGEAWQKYHEPFTIAAILKNEGYATFYAGNMARKNLGARNIFRKAMIGGSGSKYYNYTLSVNGSAISFGNAYLTDVLANYSINFLSNAPLAKPFFMTVAPPAAHAPFLPAERHRNAFPNVKALRNPSFNYTPIDKHWVVGMPPSHLPENVTILDDIYKHRLESLLAVDELVGRIIKKLQQLKILNETYIIFTSDNGFHIGQFTQPWDKRQPYETDVRIPMIISGPGIASKSIEGSPVAAVDIAPTILQLGGLEVPPYMDGSSFKDILFSIYPRRFDKRVFVEYWGESDNGSVDSGCPWGFDQHLAECSIEQWCKCQDSKNNTYACVIAFTDYDKFKFCRFEDRQGFVEAYNLTEDPYELVNVYKNMEKETIDGYVKILGEFQKCSGKSCML